MTNSNTTTTNTNNNNKRRPPMTSRRRAAIAFGVFALFGLVFLAWLFTPRVAYWAFENQSFDRLDKIGQLGDSFGSVNALFSAFAFVGVILAIIMQSRELQLQREELEETREQLERSANAQTDSVVAMKAQADSLLIAAYLNAINSTQAFYAGHLTNSQLPAEKQFELLKIQLQLDGIIASLKSRMQGIVQDIASNEALRIYHLRQICTDRIQQCYDDLDLAIEQFRHSKGSKSNMLAACRTFIREIDVIGKSIDKATEQQMSFALVTATSGDLNSFVNWMESPPPEGEESTDSDFYRSTWQIWDSAKHWLNNFLELNRSIERPAELN